MKKILLTTITIASLSGYAQEVNEPTQTTQPTQPTQSTTKNSVYFEYQGMLPRYSIGYTRTFFQTDNLEFQGRVGISYFHRSYSVDFASYTLGADLYFGPERWKVRPVLGVGAAHLFSTQTEQPDPGGECVFCDPVHVLKFGASVGVDVRLGDHWSVQPRYYFNWANGLKGGLYNASSFGVQLRYRW